MAHKEAKGKQPDKEVVEGCVNDNNETTDLPMEEKSADNVADESFESSDNTSQMADDAKQWQDKYVRLSAEFDNYRKRTFKERMDLISTASEDVVKAILPVVDDMDRALIAIETSDDIESARVGLRLIHQKLFDTLRQKGLLEIEAIGSQLDTDLHEAVAKFASDEDKKGKIIDVVQKGYKLNDKVIRFSKVVVGE